MQRKWPTYIDLQGWYLYLKLENEPCNPENIAEWIFGISSFSHRQLHKILIKNEEFAKKFQPPAVRKES